MRTASVSILTSVLPVHTCAMSMRNVLIFTVPMLAFVTTDSKATEPHVPRARPS